MKYFLLYLCVINIVGFLAMALDKQRARKKLRRIRESTLIWVAILGGSLGVLAGMQVCHHKTLHKKFSIGVPLILILQLLLFVFLYLR